MHNSLRLCFISADDGKELYSAPFSLYSLSVSILVHHTENVHLTIFSLVLVVMVFSRAWPVQYPHNQRELSKLATDQSSSHTAASQNELNIVEKFLAAQW